MTLETQTFSDDDVVLSVLDGRTQNFEVLINRYKNKIVNFTYRMISDYDEAQSLTQDVFLKVFEILKKYKSQDNFQAFIFTIARNLTLNYIKKHKRVSSLSHHLGPEEAENRYFQSAETAHRNLEDEGKQQLLSDGLKALKENQRLALILKIYLDLPYKEIQRITGWSQSKIETLISRGRSNLRDYVTAIEKNQNGIGGQQYRQPQTGTKEKRMQENEISNVIEMRSI